jgi:AcrR family transcriptional regulator
MAQIKKAQMREAILDAALQLFATRGYSATTLSAVAAKAGTATANVYVYFDSKLDILYAIYTPWMQQRLAALERDLARPGDARNRLKKLLTVLWCDIPAEQNGFAINMMQAISTVAPGDGYKPTLLQWMEERLARMLVALLPPARRRHTDAAALAHLLVMALDGFIIYRHLSPANTQSETAVQSMCDLILGTHSRTRPATMRRTGTTPVASRTRLNA